MYCIRFKENIGRKIGKTDHRVTEQEVAILLQCPIRGMRGCSGKTSCD